MVQLDQRYQQDAAIVAREIAGEMILVPVRQHGDDLHCIYTLNETGSWIWSQLDGQRTLAEIHAGLVAAYEVESTQAQQDLLELIEELETLTVVRKV